ncbi:serine hydrolase [uncultured Winogradskyella sp.]|uniref:serine hydrolase domain-containing protein n=1 Tax=uncultured Winogradskyella sp. TaxID=395353 RepID=UPI00260D70F6|nr:serine hydrolase [uncultured Winogradskyella sp.]
MEIFRNRIYFIILICLTTTTYGQDYEDFTLEESRKFHQEFENSMFIGGGEMSRYLYLHYSEFFPHTVITRGDTIRELPIHLRKEVSNHLVTIDSEKKALHDYVYNSPTDGVIIIHKGQIVFEEYPRMLPKDKHIYFSVSKTFVSTLIAILEDRGMIDVSKPIEHYMPELKNSGWEGIPVIDILDMSSGINCREKEEGAYYNPETCFQKFMAGFGFPNLDNALDNPVELLKSMEKYEPNGKKMDYTSINTWLLGWLIERVSEKSFSDMMATEIWQKIGAESDALMLTGTQAHAATPLGVNSNLRDLGRFGLLFTSSGKQAPYDIISDNYLEKIQNGGRPEIYANGYWPNLFKDETVIKHNTYQWDHVTQEGDFFKAGIGGQGLYISPSRDLVIAFFGTHDENMTENLMPMIARQLAISGLFDE